MPKKLLNSQVHNKDAQLGFPNPQPPLLMAMKPWHIYTSNYSKPKSLPKEWNFGKGTTLKNAIKYPHIFHIWNHLHRISCTLFNALVLEFHIFGQSSINKLFPLHKPQCIMVPNQVIWNKAWDSNRQLWRSIGISVP